MRRVAPAALLLVLVSTLAAGCGGNTSTESAKAASSGRTCPKAWRAGWQRLANRIQAPVYCPRWMPDPLTGQIQGRVSFGGSGGSALSVDKDRSYLATFVWAEPQSGEVHVNLRGYPGRTTVPTCIKHDFNRGRTVKTKVPCFADPGGIVRANGIVARVYTANQDIDLWHILYAWRHDGGLYTVSEHVAKPLTYTKVVANLNRMLRGLVLVEPRTG
jgi:hypothetical protein